MEPSLCKLGKGHLVLASLGEAQHLAISPSHLDVGVGQHPDVQVHKVEQDGGLVLVGGGVEVCPVQEEVLDGLDHFLPLFRLIDINFRVVFTLIRWRNLIFLGV